MRTTLILAFTAFLAVPSLMLAPAASAENPPSVPNMSNAATTPDEATKTPDGKFVQNLGDDAIAAGTVVDDHRLAPALAELVGQEARSDIGAAAGPESQDEPDRPRRPVVSGRCGRICRNGEGDDKSKRQQPTQS